MRAFGACIAILCACGARTPSAVEASPAALAVGASCDPAKDAYTCASDHIALLACDARRWRVAAQCEGAEHCVSTTSKIKCDDTVGAAGMSCASEGDMACAKDGSALLACTHGAMIETSRCRGPKACVVLAGVPTCDRTVAEEGDACDAEREVACNVKGDAILECRNKTMVQTTVCTCGVSASGTTVRCM
jgi:hypothetical protein